jgi:hypothetical protein
MKCVCRYIPGDCCLFLSLSLLLFVLKIYQRSHQSNESILTPTTPTRE